MKLLHTADIHLDTPFSMADPEQADRMRNELRAAFASLTLYARTQKMDLCLIAGDLFNNSFATRDTLAFLRREFESTPECRFVISPGNHDYYGEFSAYARAEFPQNVFVFTKPGLSCFSFDEIGTNVWGFAFCDRQYRSRVLSGFSLSATKNMNLFLGHCDLTQGASIYAPLSREEIETEIDAALFARLEHLIGKPLIHKERRGYQLPGGLTLEVNCVDPDLPTAFWYAEVEFETEAQALAWDPADCGLADYLHEECTGKPGSSMGEYWLQTRK